MVDCILIQEADLGPSPSHQLLDFLQSMNLKYVKWGYHYLITHLVILLLIPLMAMILVEASRTNPDDIQQLWVHLHYNLVSILICSTTVAIRSSIAIATLVTKRNEEGLVNGELGLGFLSFKIQVLAGFHRVYRVMVQSGRSNMFLWVLNIAELLAYLA